MKVVKMNLIVQKRIAADIFGCSKKRVVFDQERLSDIKEAITKADLRGLVSEGAIQKVQEKGVSRSRAKKRHEQRKKGRQRGQGKRKGTANARNPSKREWINKIRLQRRLLKTMKDNELIPSDVYRMLYLKAKGGFFRSKKHLQHYIAENKLVQKKEKSSEKSSNL